MRVHLVNPSDTSFGIGVITPRWLYVLAAATPAEVAPYTHKSVVMTDGRFTQLPAPPAQ